MSALHAWAGLAVLGGFFALLLNGHTLLKLLKSAVWDTLTEHLRKLSRKDRAVIDAELADLRRQVTHLTRVVADLRVRDEMTWQWVLTDQSWHREYELKAAEEGWTPITHVSYSDFREGWLKDHDNWHPFT